MDITRRSICASLLLLFVATTSRVDARNQRSVGTGSGRHKAPGGGRGKSADVKHDVMPLTMTTAHCLAHCFEQLDIAPSTHAACHQKSLCQTCSHMCQLYQTRPATWQRDCKALSCDRGCQAACSHDFRLRHRASPVGARGAPEWTFLTRPTIRVLNEGLTMAVRWTRPARHLAASGKPGSRRPRFVYVLVEHKYGEWTPLKWTTSSHTRITLGPATATAYPRRQFRLLALTSGEVAANVTVPEIGPSAVNDHNQTPVVDESSGEIPAWLPTPKVEPILPGVFYPVEVALSEVTAQGHVDAMVRWRQTLAPYVHDAVYVITWVRTSCHVNKAYPPCHLPAAPHTMNITVSRKESVQVGIRQLVFNARYTIDVGFKSHPSQRVHFTTPACTNPDPTFRQCLPESAAAVTSMDQISVTPDGAKGITSGPLVDALVAGIGEKTEKKPEGKGAVVAEKQNRMGMVAGLASFLCVAAVCLGVATYVVYRRWTYNRQTSNLRSLRQDAARGLWMPVGTLQHDVNSVLSAGAQGSFRRNPLADRLVPLEDAQQLRGLDDDGIECDTLEEDDSGHHSSPTSSVELPRSMWTRVSPDDDSGALRHVTGTPEVNNDDLAEKLSNLRLFRRTSTTRSSRFPTRCGAAKLTPDVIHPSANTTVDLQLSSIHGSSVHDLEERPDVVDEHDDDDNDDVFSDDDADVPDAVLQKCTNVADFSASLHLSTIDTDCYNTGSEDEDEDACAPSDGRYRKPTFTSFKPPTPTPTAVSDCENDNGESSFSTQEGSYSIRSPENSMNAVKDMSKHQQEEEEEQPLLQTSLPPPGRDEDHISQLSLNRQIRHLLQEMDKSFDGFFDEP